MIRLSGAAVQQAKTSWYARKPPSPRIARCQIIDLTQLEWSLVQRSALSQTWSWHSNPRLTHWKRANDSPMTRFDLCLKQPRRLLEHPRVSAVSCLIIGWNWSSSHRIPLKQHKRFIFPESTFIVTYRITGAHEIETALVNEPWLTRRGHDGHVSLHAISINTRWRTPWLRMFVPWWVCHQVLRQSIKVDASANILLISIR